MVTEGQKQEKGRRCRKGEKYLMLLMDRGTNTKERHKARPASIPQSYSSALTLLKLKDIQRTANCEHHKQNSGYVGYSHTTERPHPPVTSSCSYQKIFIQGEWGRKEIRAWRTYNEKMLEKRTSRT